MNGSLEALAMLHVRKPALMILDVEMPDMDGLTLLAKIREYDHLKDVRVMMYSADTRHETMAKAMRLGALDFLANGTVAFENLMNRVCERAGPPSQPN